MIPEINWKNPDYDPIFRHRSDLIRSIREDASLVPSLKAYYKDNWVDFIQDWMVTYDPRNVTTTGNTIIPFILFPRQKDFILWLKTRWERKERGLAEKSRDVGLSWLACACAVIIFLFYDNANIGFGSRKRESVDNGLSDPDSLFWKCRKLIDTLPEFFVPKSYGSRNKWGLIVNMENGSTIKGEVGDAIGMGGRTSIHIVDEADALEHPMLTEASLSATTDCRIDISTANHVGSVFYNNRRSLPEEQIFIFDWIDDPRKRQNPDLDPSQEPWYLKQLKELDRTVVASQIDRNPNAALSNTFITSDLIDVAQTRLVSEIATSEHDTWRIGVDASGTGNDETVFWRRRGRISLPPMVYSNIDGVQMAMAIEKMCNDLVKIAPIALIAIEKDGPGGSCADQLKYGPYASVVRSMHTGSRIKDGHCYNQRSWMHKQAKEYLQEEAPYLPRDATFKAQATSILYEYRAGLLLIESKESYRKRLSGTMARHSVSIGRSPDRWDAFVLSFAPPKGEPIKKLITSLPKKYSSWKPLDSSMGY